MSLRSLHDMMDRLFSDHFMTPFGRFGLSESMQSFSPKVDVSETEKEIKVRAEVPGINPDDVSIEVTEDTLSIAGTIEKSNEEKDENYYRMERSSGRFSREFMLPSKIDADNVNAEAKNGVITITLTKQPSEQKRKVEIKA
jgi:HSP20 family protein